MQWTVERAERFAQFAHAGQQDQAGNDYFVHHVRPVWEQVRDDGYDEDHQIVALLHDAVEDWPDGPVQAFMVLQQMEFPPHLAEALNMITHRRNEARARYYQRVLDSEIVTVVKRYDVAQNDDPCRIALIRDGATRDRLIEKYRLARRSLGMPSRDPESYRLALTMRRLDEAPRRQPAWRSMFYS